MASKNKEVLIMANAAIAKGDYEGFLSFCTEDTKWVFVGDKTLEGKEAVRQWMAVEYVEPPKFNVEYLIAEGDHVVALGKISIKNKNGEVVDYAYSDVWGFREGKMAELHAFVIDESKLPGTKE